MYRQHRLREIGLRRGVSRDKNGLRRGLAGLNRTWTFDPCTPCLKFCTPTFKILPNSLITIDVRNKICKLRTSRTISGLALFKSASPMSIQNRRAPSLPELQTTDYSAIKTSSDAVIWYYR